MKVIAVLSPGLELQGAKELLELGVSSAKPQKRCVAFETDIRTLYRVNLLARLPFRFLREIAQFPCNTPQDLYQNVRSSFDWHTWLKPTMSFRVDVSGIGNALRHTHFTALQVKNAIVDLQRERWGSRSDIDVVNPDLCIHLHLAYNHAILSLGTSSKTLHKRGYRPAMGIAPLKENLAAGLIRLSKWDGSVPLVDPLCGSGTFLIEAVSAVLGLAPGVERSFLVENWADFDQTLWELEKKNARNY